MECKNVKKCKNYGNIKRNDITLKKKKKKKRARWRRSRRGEEKEVGEEEKEVGGEEKEVGKEEKEVLGAGGGGSEKYIQLFSLMEIK